MEVFDIASNDEDKTALLFRYTDEFGNVHKIKKRQNHTEKETLVAHLCFFAACRHSRLPRFSTIRSSPAIQK